MEYVSPVLRPQNKRRYSDDLKKIAKRLRFDNQFIHLDSNDENYDSDDDKDRLVMDIPEEIPETPELESEDDEPVISQQDDLDTLLKKTEVDMSKVSYLPIQPTRVYIDYSQLTIPDSSKIEIVDEFLESDKFEEAQEFLNMEQIRNDMWLKSLAEKSKNLQCKMDNSFNTMLETCRPVPVDNYDQVGSSDNDELEDDEDEDLLYDNFDNDEDQLEQDYEDQLGEDYEDQDDNDQLVAKKEHEDGSDSDSFAPPA